MAQQLVPGLLTMKEVMSISSVGSRSTIYRLCRQGRFPPPCYLASGQIRWREDDLRDWMDKLPTRHYPPNEIPSPASQQQGGKGQTHA